MNKIKRLASFAYVSFLAAWSMGFIAWLGKLAMAQRLFVYLVGNVVVYIDFVTFFMCGKLAASAARKSIYDPNLQLAFYNQAISPLHVSIAPYAQYVPWFFLLMAPLSVLNLSWCYVVWNVVVVGFGLLSLAFLLYYLHKASIKNCTLFSLWLLACYPAQDAIHYGQTGWLLLGLLAAFSRFYLQSRDIACGVILALLSLKPQYLPFLLIPALAQKRWKVLLSFAVTLFGLIAFSALIFGLDTIVGYPSVLVNVESSHGDVDATWMVSLRGVLSMLTYQNIAFHISLAVALIALAALFYCWRKTKKQALRWALSLTVVVMLVLSPHTHVHDLTLLAVPFALTLPELTGFDYRQLKPNIYRLWVLIFLALPIIGFALFGLIDLIPNGELRSLVFLTLDTILLVLAYINWKQSAAEG